MNELIRVVDALPGLIWTASSDGNVDFLNQRWREYVGTGIDQTGVRNWHSVVHSDDRIFALELWQSVLASGQPGEMEARLRRFDGEYRWFLFRISRVVDSTGRVIQGCGIATDIQARKEVQQTSLESEQRFDLILDSLPAHINILTAEGKPVHVNRQYREYVGATLEEQKGWPIGRTFHPDDRANGLATWRRSVETGEPYDFEGRRRRADGVYRWFNLRAFPLRDEHGRIVLWYSVHTDIDDRKRAEGLLAGEKRLLEMVADGRAMPRILEALCDLVESTATGCYCSVLLVDAQGRYLEHGAAPNLPASFITSIIGRPVNADSGPCAMAAYLNEPVIAADLRSETRWAAYDWCPMALAHGLQACWSMPISSAHNVLGAFAIYYSEPRAPTVQDRALIDQFSHIASIAIERQRSQASLTRALSEIEKSEGRLRTIIDAMPGFVWSTTPDGTVDFLNRGWCDYTGVSMEDALGAGWEAAIHPDDVDALMQYWRGPLESGQPGQYEARFRRFDGTYRWLLSKAVPLHDEAGNVVRWYGLNTDIDDRKQAEMLLAGEKRLLEMVAGGAPLTSILDAFCLLVEAIVQGCLCSILLVDPRRSHLHSVTSAHLRLQPGAAPSLPSSLMEGIDGRPVDANSGPCAMAATLNKQVVVEDLVRETRWDEWTTLALSHGMRANWSTPIRSTSGEVLGTFAILYREARTPSTVHQNLIARFAHLASIAIERSQGQAALKRSEAFLAKAQRLSSSGSFSWCVATGEITWSEQVYRIFELDPDLPVTLDVVGSRQHPEDITLLHDMFERAKAAQDFEYGHRLQMPDGSVKYLHTVAHATRDADGQLEYIGAVQDVTERRLSEEALSKVRSELAHVARVTSLGALTASIAHEVNQPLSGIITNASTCLRMLAADPPNVDGAQETARRTIRDGQRASDVIKRLRALFSKKATPTGPVDLNEATREVIALSLSELQRNQVILRTELDERLPPVRGDRVQLQQVILNLLLNASEAMRGVTDRPKQLVVGTRRAENDVVHLSVRDVGTGFDPHAVDKLFQAFYTTKGDGMGIGLSISRSIIDNHGGRLWAESNEGPGATFLFTIPSDSEEFQVLHRGGAAESSAERNIAAHRAN
jgi:PAS domain S-box-containing protein